MRWVLLVVTLLLFSAHMRGWAQHCFQWQLEAGTQLRFHVEAYDTVALVGEPALFRHRSEEWRVACDSTHGDTLFLRQWLERYRAREWTERGDSSTRTTIPHVGVTTRLVLTRRGWRVRVTSSIAGGMSVVPGGTFGPVFFVPLDSSCTACGRAQWLVEQRDTLVEYAVPPAHLVRLYLGSVDSCSADGIPRVLSFAETSSAEHLLPIEGGAMYTAAWTLSHGVVELDPATQLPRRLFYATEQRLRITHPRPGTTRHGTQRTSLSAVVEVSSPPVGPR
ncbi:MAG: hypothetical protein KatS3mg038_0674 [Candidatus Kapaibacterium sp.]|nr:MAG: hypothetical protein KatS3mg038_0674 [Candidatus Kapabacteria bacterium]